MNKPSSWRSNINWQGQKQRLQTALSCICLLFHRHTQPVQHQLCRQFHKLGKYLYLSARFWLAGPVAFFLALFIMAGLMLWLPYDDNNNQGDGQLYHLIFPSILFPLIWCGCFFYPLLDNDVKRASVLMLALLFLNVGIVIVLMVF